MKTYYFVGIRYNNFDICESTQRKRSKKEFPNKKLHFTWIRNKYGVWTACRIRTEEEV